MRWIELVCVLTIGCLFQVIAGCAPPPSTTLTGKVKAVEICYEKSVWSEGERGYRTSIIFEDGRQLQDLRGLADVQAGQVYAVTVGEKQKLIGCKRLDVGRRYEIYLDERGNTISINGEPPDGK